MNRAVALIVAMLCCLALAGCGDSTLPRPSPRPTSEVVPVLTSAQLSEVVTRVIEGIADADAKRDATALAQFADGPALTERAAAYSMLAKNPQLTVLTPIGAERLQDVVPQDGQWPRSLLTVTRRDAADTLPMLLVLTQHGPREQYKLTAYVPMIGGASLPRTAAIRDGVQTRRMGDGAGLKVAPRDALDLYAALLTSGPAVPRAELIGPSPLTEAIVKGQDETRNLLTVTCPGCFTVTIDNQSTGRLWTFDTTDAGALVIGEIDQQTAIAAQSGFVTDLGPEVQALAGVAKITKESQQTRTIMVALTVPPGKADGPVTVVGGSSVLISATAS